MSRDELNKGHHCTSPSMQKEKRREQEQNCRDANWSL